MLVSSVLRVVVAATLLAASWTPSLAEAPPSEQPMVVADAHGTEQPELSPRYEPVPPEPKSSYNSDYLFGMTRGVADSTIHPAGKVPLFLLTVPLDIVLLPFAAIGGLFG